MTQLTVKRVGVKVFDELSLNTEHRLEFNNGVLEAVYPANATETDYIAASVSTDSNGDVELPSNSAVLSVSDGAVIALIPEEEY